MLRSLVGSEMCIRDRAQQKQLSYIDPYRPYILKIDESVIRTQYINPQSSRTLKEYLEVGEEFDPEKNGPLIPEGIYDNSIIVKRQVLYTFGVLKNIWRNQIKEAIFSDVLRFQLYRAPDFQIIRHVVELVEKQQGSQDQYFYGRITKLESDKKLALPSDSTQKVCGIFDEEINQWVEEQTCSIVSENNKFFVIKFQRCGDYAILMLKKEALKYPDVLDDDNSAYQLGANMLIFILSLIHI
eukprot:TRINITY_DN10114_c0_g1_i2.p1 TRINITY_DN10114_c0_g1~~TRINITY_DN10114_c0_g1_i2.p1  ORF type:complete len:241 (-),score=38.51 TRINITY_DN10114_c0_g1_i2:60-782(-)